LGESAEVWELLQEELEESQVEDTIVCPLRVEEMTLPPDPVLPVFAGEFPLPTLLPFKYTPLSFPGEERSGEADEWTPLVWAPPLLLRM